MLTKQGAGWLHIRLCGYFLIAGKKFLFSRRVLRQSFSNTPNILCVCQGVTAFNHFHGQCVCLAAPIFWIKLLLLACHIFCLHECSQLDTESCINTFWMPAAWLATAYLTRWAACLECQQRVWTGMVRGLACTHHDSVMPWYLARSWCLHAKLFVPPASWPCAVGCAGGKGRNDSFSSPFTISSRQLATLLKKSKVNQHFDATLYVHLEGASTQVHQLYDLSRHSTVVLVRSYLSFSSSHGGSTDGQNKRMSSFSQCSCGVSHSWIGMSWFNKDPSCLWSNSPRCPVFPSVLRLICTWEPKPSQ